MSNTTLDRIEGAFNVCLPLLSATAGLLAAARGDSVEQWAGTLPELAERLYGWMCEYVEVAKPPSPFAALATYAGDAENSPMIRVVRHAADVERRLWEGVGLRQPPCRPEQQRKRRESPELEGAGPWQPPYRTPGVGLHPAEVKSLAVAAEAVRLALRGVTPLDAEQVARQMETELARAQTILGLPPAAQGTAILQAAQRQPAPAVAPRKWNATEEVILETIGDETMTAEEIATSAAYSVLSTQHQSSLLLPPPSSALADASGSVTRPEAPSAVPAAAAPAPAPDDSVRA